MRRLLIAPDSFKLSCSAEAAARALARGARSAARARSTALEVEILPLSDGGDGFIDALHHSIGGEIREASCRWPDRRRGEARRPARWLWHPSDETAYAETACVVGLHLTREASPLQRTAVGIGDYLRAIRAERPRRIVLGVGGTSTVDGGVSVTSGLGAAFWRSARRADRDRLYPQDPCELDAETAVDLPARWVDVEVECWCDVTTPLIGEAGAAPTFAPQKGAAPAEVEQLGAAIDAWAERAAGYGRVSGQDPGTGAGGGIPFGVLLAVGGSIRLGSEAVAQQVDLEGRITDADWVWTGEGRFDPTTREGKLVAEVIRVAALRDRPVTVIAGQVLGDAMRSSGHAQVAVISLVGPGVSVEDAMARPTQHLERVGQEEMARLLSRVQ